MRPSASLTAASHSANSKSPRPSMISAKRSVCSSTLRPAMNSTISRRRESSSSPMPSGSSMPTSGLSSPVVVLSPAVDGTLPATSRAASIRAQTFSVLMRSSGMAPPFTRGTDKPAVAIPARSNSGFGNLAGDDQALDVAGALVDLADADIAVDPLDREIGEIPVAAMDLDGVGSDPLVHFRGEQFGHRRLGQAGLAGIAPGRRVEHQPARRGDLGRHIGEAERHRLMRDDLLAEGLALLRVDERRLIGRPRHADRLRGDAEAPALKVRQRDAVAL